MNALYPLTFDPILKPKVWGGRRLERYGKALPGADGSAAPPPIGESWEIADLASTSVSGGGGNAARSVINAGALAGMTLHDAIGRYGEDLLGYSWMSLSQRACAGAFPLLVKYLDAREHLSVQVHPSPEYAAAHPGAHLKTESWYVLEAEAVDGAEPLIFKGLRRGVGREDLRRAIEEGTVPDLLVAVPAVVGECHTLPSGTCHALGAGVLVAEIQTPSDTTFRVYDWAKEYGRAGRELHVEQALESAVFSPPPDAAALGPRGRAGRLAATDAYMIDELRLGEPMDVAGSDGSAVVVMAIDGAGEIASRGARFEPVGLTCGVTALVPASIAGDAFLRAAEGTTMRVLCARLP